MNVKFVHCLMLYLSFFMDIVTVSSQIRKSFKQQPTLKIDDQLKQCCLNINVPKNLFDCIVNVSSVINEKIVSTHSSNGAPSLAVGIVSFATHNIQNYTAYAFAVNAVYAAHNNYILKLLDPETSDYDGHDSRWNKVKILEEALHPETGWARDLDYVMWVDADMVVLDMGLRLEKVAVEFPDAHIFASAEHAGSTTLINSGSVLVRNSAYARDFLARWWNYADRVLYSDQEQFDLLYKEEQNSDPRLREKIVILAPDALNSDPPAMTQQKEYNQVLHLMGEQMPYRAHVFRSAYEEICHHLHTAQPEKDQLAAQLTVTQENLLIWTMQVYSLEAKHLLDSYQAGAATGAHTLSVSRDMANSVHHFAHALEHTGMVRSSTSEVQQKNAVLAVRLRQQVYKLMLQNLNVQRSAHLTAAVNSGMKGYPYPSDWPEHVKTVATAGQHLLTVGSVTERSRLADELMELMEEMLATSNRLQHPAIQHMIAYMYMQKGMQALHQDSYDLHQAHEHLRHSLDISVELSKASGEHILVSPLTLCANVLSTLERHSEAYDMYQQAISLSELHLGPTHESLGTLLVNFGISLVQMTSYAKAVPVLERAIKVMRANDPQKLNRGSVSYTRAVEFLKHAKQGVKTAGGGGSMN